MPYTTSLVSHGGRAVGVHGDFSEAVAAEMTAEGSEALALEGVAPNPHWTYSATAEDNGTVGALDAQPGLIYSGPITTAMRVSVSGLTLSEGTIVPEATDDIAAGVFKNSTLVATLATEAGVSVITETDAFSAAMEGDVIVDAVADGDVIRIGLISLNEETVDIDVAVGGAFSIG